MLTRLPNVSAHRGRWADTVIPLLGLEALPIMHQPSQEFLLTTKEVAHLLRIHLRTFWRWKASGRFSVGPIYLGGRTFRYRREDVERWLENHSIRNEETSP